MQQQTCLGYGGYGSVFSCGTDSVVKVFHEKYSSEDHALVRDIIFHESCSHLPGVVNFRSVCLDKGGQWRIVMERADQDLFQFVNYTLPGSVLPFSTCIHMLKDISTALAGLHSNYVTHRDVKVENILVFKREEKPYQFCLTDFGLSRAGRTKGSNTLKRFPPGSYNIRAPEVILGSSELGPEVDIFALGCTVLDCLLPSDSFFVHGRDSEVGQLMSLLRFMGSPDFATDWGAALALPLFSSRFPKCRPSEAWVRLSKRTGTLGRLLERMLAWDPKRRPTANQITGVLDEEIFKVGPSPPIPERPVPVSCLLFRRKSCDLEGRQNVVDWWMEVYHNHQPGGELTTVIASLLFLDAYCYEIGSFPPRIMAAAIMSLISSLNDEEPLEVRDIVRWASDLVVSEHKVHVYKRRILVHSTLRRWVFPALYEAHRRPELGNRLLVSQKKIATK